MNDEKGYETGERVWCTEGMEIVSGTDIATGAPLVVFAIKHEEKIYSVGLNPDLCLQVFGEVTEKYFKCKEATEKFEREKKVKE